MWAPDAQILKRQAKVVSLEDSFQTGKAEESIYFAQLDDRAFRKLQKSYIKGKLNSRRNSFLKNSYCRFRKNYTGKIKSPSQMNFQNYKFCQEKNLDVKKKKIGNEILLP